MALQTQKQEVLRLDPPQEHMLVALVLLHEQHPERRFSYPAISDKVRDHTQNKVVPTLRELQLAKRPLLDHGLISDEGIGFVPTAYGVKFFQQNRRVLAVH